MTAYEQVLEHYLKFPDRSDFVPVAGGEGGVSLLYSGSGGLAKARFLTFYLGVNAALVPSEKEKIFEILETLGGDVSGEEYGSDEEILEDGEGNILSASYDDAPIIKLVNQLMIQAVKNGASDIHFEGKDNAFAVRFRVDGKLSHCPNQSHFIP